MKLRTPIDEKVAVSSMADCGSIDSKILEGEAGLGVLLPEQHLDGISEFPEVFSEMKGIGKIHSIQKADDAGYDEILSTAEGKKPSSKDENASVKSLSSDYAYSSLGSVRDENDGNYEHIAHPNMLGTPKKPFESGDAAYEYADVAETMKMAPLPSIKRKKTEVQIQTSHILFTVSMTLIFAIAIAGMIVGWKVKNELIAASQALAESEEMIDNKMNEFQRDLKEMERALQDSIQYNKVKIEDQMKKLASAYPFSDE